MAKFIGGQDEGLALLALMRGEPVGNAGHGVEDEQRDYHGRWTKGQDIPAAARPKLKTGLYPKSDALHEAAADKGKADALFQVVHPKERGKLTRLLEELRSGGDAPSSQEQSPPTADTTAAHLLVKQAVGEQNLAKLSDLRQKMERAGFKTREEQDAALLALRKQGKIGMSSPEGRHKTSEEERAAWLRVDGETMGHVYLRS